MKQLQALFAFLLTSLNLESKDDIIIDGKLSLDDDQAQKLTAAFGDEALFVQAKKAINTALAAEQKESVSEAELKKIKVELDAFNDGSQKNMHAKDGEEPANASDVKKLVDTLKAQQISIDKMKDLPVADSPLEVIKGTPGASHSATHLFASGKSYDAFEGRNWNALRAGISAEATNFNDKTNITNLKEDVEHFIMDHPDALQSLFWEDVELPAEWSRVGGVADMRGGGFIIPTEVTQARKPHWAPKGNFGLPVEAGKVWAKQVDLTFTGYELQKIQTTWLNKKYNNVGSHPWKFKFVFALLTEIFKQVKLDTKEAMIKGVRVETPIGLTGLNINSQDGLLYHYWLYRDVQKKYRPSSIGTPSSANIVDYIDALVKNIPEGKRKAKGLELQLSQKWLDAYRVAAGKEYTLTMLTEEGRTIYSKNHVLNYDNIMFQPVFTDTDFLAITLSKNVEIMFYDNAEKEKVTVTEEKRDLHLFMDFREGIRLTFVGMKLREGDPRAFEVQAVWSNNVPIFEADYVAPVFDDTTGLVSLNFTHYKVDDSFNTNITKLENVKAGVLYKISANANVVGTAVVLKKNTTNAIASDFNLKTGGTIILIGQPDGTVKEITRVANQSIVSEDVKFDGTAIDADEGAVFQFDGAAAVTLADILNGTEGQQVVIKGNGEAAVTVAGANIETDNAAVLATATDSITLINVSGKWYELSRVIA